MGLQLYVLAAPFLTILAFVAGMNIDAIKEFVIQYAMALPILIMILFFVVYFALILEKPAPPVETCDTNLDDIRTRIREKLSRNVRTLPTGELAILLKSLPHLKNFPPEGIDLLVEVMRDEIKNRQWRISETVKT